MLRKFVCERFFGSIPDFENKINNPPIGYIFYSYSCASIGEYIIVFKLEKDLFKTDRVKYVKAYELERRMLQEEAPSII